MGKKDGVKKSQSYAYGYDFSSEYVEEDQFECRVDSVRTLFGLIATSFNKPSFSLTKSSGYTHAYERNPRNFNYILRFGVIH